MNLPDYFIYEAIFTNYTFRLPPWSLLSTDVLHTWISLIMISVQGVWKKYFRKKKSLNSF